MIEKFLLFFGISWFIPYSEAVCTCMNIYEPVCANGITFSNICSYVCYEKDHPNIRITSYDVCYTELVDENVGTGRPINMVRHLHPEYPVSDEEESTESLKLKHKGGKKILPDDIIEYVEHIPGIFTLSEEHWNEGDNDGNTSTPKLINVMPLWPVWPMWNGKVFAENEKFKGTVKSLKPQKNTKERPLKGNKVRGGRKSFYHELMGMGQPTAAGGLITFTSPYNFHTPTNMDK